MEQKENSALTAEEYEETVERLLEEPYHVIDFLPVQVPADSGGQYFAAEDFYREHTQRRRLYRKFADILLGLNCYHDLVVTDGRIWETNPPPGELYGKIENCPENGFLNILIGNGDSLITLTGGDLYLTLYRATGELLQLTEKLASARGLFVREGNSIN
ncbi:MAG: hypothetical protein IKH56_05760 [Oscillospiraceae bacterium]|nr:hypothetical protein [Oscillospiraceae bacterium]